LYLSTLVLGLLNVLSKFPTFSTSTFNAASVGNPDGTTVPFFASLNNLLSLHKLAQSTNDLRFDGNYAPLTKYSFKLVISPLVS